MEELAMAKQMGLELVIAKPRQIEVLVAQGTGCVPGAHLLGPQAEGVINLFAPAVRRRLPAWDLAGTLTTYPSGGSNISSMLG
jgi:glutathione reductase (NADPH)